MTYQAPEIISICGLILFSIIFYRHAKTISKERFTLDGFTLADRNLKKQQFGNTFAASNFSLAMTVLFFISNHKLYGLFLLVSPISYIAGHYFFLYLLKKSNVDFKKYRTIADLCYLVFPSKAIARLVTLMTLSSFVMLVFIELYIGSIVFTIFLPENIYYQTFSFFCIGLIVLCYVRLGGYKALVTTDTWQISLMLIAVISLFVYSVLIPINGNISYNNEVLTNILKFDETNYGIAQFLLWLIPLNLILPFTNISHWQRTAATQNMQVSWQGLTHASWKFLTLFTLPILAFILLSAKGYELTTIKALIDSMRESNWFTCHILFPSLVIGFCSTVFSSADTAIIAIMYSLSDNNTFLKKLQKMRDYELRRALTLMTLFILIVLSGIYLGQFSSLQTWLVPLIYGVCGQLAILTPLPIYILVKLSKSETFQPFKVTRGNIQLLFNCILFSWIFLLLSVYLAQQTQSQYWTQISTPLGILVVGLALLKLHRNRANAQHGNKLFFGKA